MKPIKVVAFGGGHGLSASLRALRATGLPLELTAVVTVADDGGSSGRLRAARSVLPPGDLRQALAALAAADGVSDGTARLMQYRFTGSDELAGHPVGNVVLCGLMELLGDPVAALEHAQAMVHAVGRVLPMSCHPLGIEADLIVDGKQITVRGQHQVAVAPGRVVEVRLEPPQPQPCPQAIEAIGAADWLVFGPGSWYTSVIPHLLVPEQAAAIVASPARRLVTLNLAADRETVGLSLPDHLAALSRYLPDLKVDIVLVDRNAVPDPEPVANAAESLGARIALAPVAVDDGTPRHDPVRLGRALVPLLRTAR
ncbi:uridine diphosphate-N-acetylglucosamine-binding protein YvcK [Catellatospora sp. TT07R-123]|uniref:gluconeogenesis factor YvcK family protein n=1 Tax=Catellatospora sp. TT07R-123 TaxID=2733863 RepID=UPI001BB39DD3|nr:uridine diphosphate-N-acetylglucosamine-binding protein YvcK [Catellatospora sp. TT07R-123]